MALRKYIPPGDAPPGSAKSLCFARKALEKPQIAEPGPSSNVDPEVDIDLREIYFLIMHFLSAGPCHRTYGQFWNELLEHQLLPRRYHAWYSRTGVPSGDENDDGFSFPLSYNKLVERYPHVEKNHLVKLLKQLILSSAPPLHGMPGGNPPNASDVPTLLGSGSFSLLDPHMNTVNEEVKPPPGYMRWPHMQADQVRGLSLREIGGGFTRHHRSPSIRAACYAIAKPSTMVQKMQNIKKTRGHRSAVYCAIFDRLGRYVITGSDDRLVKIWSMETAYCLASCRGHEGDITDLAVSSNNALVASSSNDCIIRVWRLPDGLPISVLRGHTGAVTAIAFSPRPSSVYQLLSSSDDGTCRIWDARHSTFSPRIYVPRPPESVAGRNTGTSLSVVPQNHQIFCCAFNASGTVFVTGSSDTLARVWNACKSSTDDSEQPNHEMDVLSGHENDVNYVQFSGCAVASRFSMTDTSKEENIPKFKNSWFNHDNIVTCSRDGSAIIWVPRSRRSHGKIGRWQRAYHLKVPPPPMPPQPPRGGPRQRILPTPRGVNMIVWSLDNRFVLAAIMDCRICVWNAVDGSLVHSLTGHSESTYVLDVHPFNPRIAMSAGYDGKTIVWDIWEGTPIRIYEIGRFKLVDGKFSPDGTSIILSDDVGQLYILNTGQGESQKDAKYDQFFLGDYRPLIQDTQGNFLDQETQLAPYRRNIQDLLCDSGMIPYPEPYQSMYQQRRLGALGIEWRPSSLRFAVGPDITLDQEYQMLPLADLDILIDPLPEFIDAMDWEPENEVQSEDTDSEYNVPGEYSSGEEPGSLSSNSSGDPECSAEDSDVDNTLMDGLRRSKRKKRKSEIEVTTSSGRRVKRRNLDECDGTSSKSNLSRKSRNGRKTSRKSSKLKSLRPQRAAARNALTLFSRITGNSTDGEEDEDGSEGDLSESESLSNIESEDSERSLPDEKYKLSKGKEVSLDESEDIVAHDQRPESHRNASNSKRLVLKLPVRDSNRLEPPESAILACANRDELVGSSSKATSETNCVDNNHVGSEDLGYSSGGGRKRGLPEKVEDHLDDKIRWGGVRARSSKRPRSGEANANDAYAGPSECIVDQVPIENKPENECDVISQSPGIQIQGQNMADVGPMNNQQFVPGNTEGFDHSRKVEDQSKINGYRDCNESPKRTPSLHYKNGIDHSIELKEHTSTTPTKFRIRTKEIRKDCRSPGQLKIRSPVRNDGCTPLFESSSDEEQNQILEMPLEYDGSKRPSSSHGCWNGSQKTEFETDQNSRPFLQDSQELHSQSNNRMYNAVYRRTRSHRTRNNPECDGRPEESTSNAKKNTADAEMGFPESAADGPRRTRSMGLKVTEDREPEDGTRRTRSMGLKSFSHDIDAVAEGHVSDDTSESAEKTSIHRNKEALSGEWRTSSRMAVGLRSARNRRVSYHIRDSSPPDRRKSNQQTRKPSWLLLATHEGGSRYIPQQGDEVVYLRQGHQEYINFRRCPDTGPWRSISENIRASEFCKVVTLEYSALPGSGESCCKMTLQFVDPASSVYRRTFRLTLPEVTSFPDFLVERSRYDAAIQRNWTHRDKCQVWWKNEDDEDGSWWEGRILAVKPKSPEFPDSPWEKYSIQYKTDPTETHLHSPWELYDADTQWDQPRINDERRNMLLSSLKKLEQSGNKVQDYYGIQKLKQVAHKSKFFNRFPVPLSLELIHSRLQNNYYRSLEAMKHDISVMLSNAESYFGKNVELSTKIERLSDWFRKALATS